MRREDGTETKMESKQAHLEDMLLERVLLASLLDCRPKDVAAYNDEARDVPGGDRGWRVSRPDGQGGHDLIEVITKAGMPTMIDGLLRMPVDPVLERWGHQRAKTWEGLPEQQRRPARIACLVLAKMFGLAELTQEYVEVLGVRALGNEQAKPAGVYVVRLAFPSAPWKELGTLEVNVDTDRDIVYRVIARTPSDRNARE